MNTIRAVTDVHWQNLQCWLSAGKSRYLPIAQSQLLVNAETGQVASLSGDATNQDLSSQNVRTGLLTRNNFRVACQPSAIIAIGASQIAGSKKVQP